MSIKDKAIQYCRGKGLYDLSESEKNLKCDEAFKELRKINNDYEKNKEEYYWIRGGRP
jgi:hypothetical protein